MFHDYLNNITQYTSTIMFRMVRELISFGDVIYDSERYGSSSVNKRCHF